MDWINPQLMNQHTFAAQFHISTCIAARIEVCFTHSKQTKKNNTICEKKNRNQFHKTFPFFPLSARLLEGKASSSRLFLLTFLSCMSGRMTFGLWPSIALSHVSTPPPYPTHQDSLTVNVHIFHVFFQLEKRVLLITINICYLPLKPAN